ncbi:MAG TPA: 3-dehydroquinate synthase [Sphingobacteriaceae bacterium]
MQTIQSIGYPVHFENTFQELRDLIIASGYSKIFILVDTNTEKHCLPLLQPFLDGISYDIIEVDPGEENKNIDFCIGVWKMLLDFGADRNSLMINLGGGVVTDMGGFAAATFKRGIDFVHIPTTLLSQVDASIGGKTGIDLDQVKNIIGTFTQPKAVFIAHELLKTLDNRQLVSGFAEMLKHGLIYDPAYFRHIQHMTSGEITPEAIYRSVGIKNEVVTTDPHEKGLRKILNFGHTIGHAVETLSLQKDADPLLHGEAIAVGMICEAYLSHESNGLSAEDLHEITRTIRRNFPDYPLHQLQDPDLIAVMKNDKKNEQQRIGFALLNRIGCCDFNKFATEAEIAGSLNYYRSLIRS